jgi:Exopolyphosphatase-related proteins
MKAVLEFLQSLPVPSRIALTAHQRPDGDALGSCLGLGWVLRALGHDVTVVNVSPIPTNLYFLNCDLMEQFHSGYWYSNFDCLGVLDCGDANRLDEINRSALGKLPVFNIDHHVSSAGIGDAVWIDASASSVGEMIVRLCQEAGWQLTLAAGNALWTSIITDTGRFSYENTTPAALAAASVCLRAGAAPAEIACNIYQSVAVEERKLQAKLLGRLELYEQGKMALSWLRREDFLEAGIGMEGAQDLINLIRDTAGVEVAIFLYESGGDTPDGPSVKISLRTASPHDALAIAAKYGGGGHMRAAGCTIAAPLDEVRSQVLSTAERLFFHYTGDTVSIRRDDIGGPL